MYPQDDGALLIVKERLRQIHGEHFDPGADLRYTKGQLTIAARCYAETAEIQVTKGITDLPACYIHKDWPWDRSWFKPSSNPRRNLEKAGALMAAEIDRLLWIERAKRPEKLVSDIEERPVTKPRRSE